MKLVAIMCVAAYKDRARRLMADLKVPVYSESEMQGTKYYQDTEADNWFANKHEAVDSHLFFAMVDEKKADEMLEGFKECGKDIPENPVHAFVLNVEKYF